MGAFDLAKAFFYNKPTKPYNEEVPGEEKNEITDESQQTGFSFSFGMLDQEYDNLKNKFYNFKETLMEAYKQKCSEIDSIKNKLENLMSSYITEIPVYNSSSPNEIINNYISHLNIIIKNYAERNKEYDNKLTAVIRDKENSEFELKSQIEKLKEENENLIRKNKEEKELSERLRQWMYNKETLLFDLKIDYRDLVKSFTECEDEQIRLVNEKHDIYIEKMEAIKELEVERKKVKDKEANEKALTKELTMVTNKYNQLYSLQSEKGKNKENNMAIDVLQTSPESPSARDLVNETPYNNSKTIQEQNTSEEVNENSESNGTQQQENNKNTSVSNGRKRNYYLSFSADNEEKDDKNKKRQKNDIILIR